MPDFSIPAYLAVVRMMDDLVERLPAEKLVLE